MPDFAKYLKSYDVDINLADTAIDTPEKRAIIGLSKTYLQDFHDALANMDITYFHKLKNRDLLFEMTKDINSLPKPKINRAYVALAYNDLF